MPSTEENTEDVLNQLREALKSQPSSEKESDHLQPPSGSWATRIYENEYKPFPKWIKYLIRYGIVVIAFLIGLNHGSAQVQQFLCQWFDRFCG